VPETLSASNFSVRTRVYIGKFRGAMDCGAGLGELTALLITISGDLVVPVQKKHPPNLPWNRAWITDVLRNRNGVIKISKAIVMRMAGPLIILLS